MNINKGFKTNILLLILSTLYLTANYAYANNEFLVAIDIGHTKKHFGATSSRGVSEYLFNQKLAKVLLNKMKKTKGINAFIINPDGKEIALKERTQIASQKKADIFISLHHDSVQKKYIKYWEYGQKKNHYSDKFSGYSIFVSQKNSQFKESTHFAKILGAKLRSHGFIPTLHHAEKIKGENRELLDKELGVYRFDDLVVLKTSIMPSILLECGVIVNRREELLLNSERFRNEFADQIVDAISEYKDNYQNDKTVNDSVAKSQ